MEDYQHTVNGAIEPLADSVLIHNLKIGEQTVNGIIVLTDDAVDRGIKPRWAQVHSIGANVTDIGIDEWVLIDHGRWTRGVRVINDKEETIIRLIDRSDILCQSNEEPSEVNSATRDGVLQVDRTKMGHFEKT